MGINAVHSELHTKHSSRLWWYGAEDSNVKRGGAYNNH